MIEHNSRQILHGYDFHFNSRPSKRLNIKEHWSNLEH